MTVEEMEVMDTYKLYNVIYDNRRYRIREYNSDRQVVKLVNIGYEEPWEVNTRVWISIELIEKDKQYYREQRLNQLLEDGKRG